MKIVTILFLSLIGLIPAAQAASDADEVLQKDVQGQLGVAVPISCKEKYTIDNKKIVKKTSGETPWNEIWTIKACGKEYKVHLKFIPGSKGKGTTYEIKS